MRNRVQDLGAAPVPGWAIAVATALAATLLSAVGFSDLVGTVYPVLGYAGIAIIVMLIITWIAERTLVRAAWEAAGTSPKAFIDARVLLEAKRLLAHTDWTSGRIAVHLGFSEPTNFAKFFRKGAGLSPEAFRTQEA